MIAYAKDAAISSLKLWDQIEISIEIEFGLKNR